jgi:ATP/ADP translocase/HEAT repeat protein
LNRVAQPSYWNDEAHIHAGGGTLALVFGRLAELAFPVRRGERNLTLALFVQSFFAVGVFLTGRTVRDALYLTMADRGSLAWMYVASAAGVALAGLAYSRVASKVRRDLMAVNSAVLFAALFLAFFFLERGHQRWIYSALYVYVEIMGALVLMQFWTLVNEIFNPREAKRLYGIIGAGGTLANVVLGILAAKVALSLGTSALLWICALLLLGCAGSGFLAGHLGRERLFARAASGRAPARRVGGASHVAKDDHLRGIAALAAVTFFTTTLVDYQFKVIAADALSHDRLAAFFGNFSAVVGVLALGIQVFGTGQLLTRAGVIVSLAVLPASLGLGSAFLILWPSLWAASLTRGADTLFRYSINDATTQILYLPVPASVRVSAKAFIDGLVKPFSIAFAGLALAAYRMWFGGNPNHLARLGLTLAALWTTLVLAMRPTYLRSLQRNLKSTAFQFSAARRVMETTSSAVVEKALASEDEQEILSAVALLPHLENLALDHRVETLLRHKSSSVRIKTLEYYGHRQAMRFANSVFLCFEDPESEVRAAAINAFSAMGKDKAVRSVTQYLSDPDPKIRAAAVTGMMRFGGLDGVLAAAEALKALIAHDEPQMRQEAARVLGAIGVQNFYQPVLRLMSDDDVRVRREAILAAGVLKSPEFIPAIIQAMKSSETLRESLQSLTNYGSTALRPLEKVLTASLETDSIRRAAARVLGRLGTIESAELMMKHLTEADPMVRMNIYRSLARTVRGGRVLVRDLSAVRTALNAEFERAFRALQAAEILGSGATSRPRALLTSALMERISSIERSVFYLLAVLYPNADVEQIYSRLIDLSSADANRQRGHAVELLDNLVDKDLRRRLIPLLDDLPRAARLALVADLYPNPRSDAPTVLRLFLSDESPWIRACALWCVAEEFARGQEVDDLLSAALKDRSEFVREVALSSLQRLSPKRAAEVSGQMEGDESPAVRRWAVAARAS